MSSRPKLVDLDDLSARAANAASREYGSATVSSIRALAGGQSSLTFGAELARTGADTQRIVIKVATPGLPPVKNRDVLGQARLMRALRSAEMQVPRVMFEDAGDPPECPPFFAMEFVGGEAHEPTVDEYGETPPTDALIRSRAMTAVRELARLHSIDTEALDLPETRTMSLGADVARWERVLESVDASLSGGFRECARQLLLHVPAADAATIVHGDYRLGNIIFDDDRLAAIIDWEIWTVADHRIDLAWFLAITRSDGNPYAVRSVSALPSPRDLVAAYEDVWGHAVGDLSWFEAHTCFKQAAIMAQISKHNRLRAQPDSDIEARSIHSSKLVAEALSLLADHDSNNR